MSLAEYKTKEQKRKFYDGKEWKHIRAEVMKRDNYECQECKRQGKVFLDTHEYSERAKRKKIKLVVDHIKELEDRPELALDEDNLEVICVQCHNIKHDRAFEYKDPRWNDERW